MSNAEHLIENAIFAMKRGESPEIELNKSYNREMLEESWLCSSDICLMARHVVYSLYDGKFPEGGGA